MIELEVVHFPELFGTYISEEDQRLLDLWDQGLDCDDTSCQDKSQDLDSGYHTEQYSYDYGDHSDEEFSDSDSYNDEEESDSNSDSDSDSSDSDSDSDSDDDSSSSDSDDDDDNLMARRKCKIRPIKRKGRLARPMRDQLLRRRTLLQAFGRDHWCCSDRCITHWRFVKKRDVYRDYT